MGIREDLDAIVEQIQAKEEYLRHNAILLDVWNGNLLPYVLMDLEAQLSKKSFETIKHRVSPINVLKRVIDKKSRIYSNGVVRDIVDGTEPDQELKVFYEDSFRMSSVGGLSNSFFNLHKGFAWEPYVNSDGIPRLRAYPFDRFVPIGTDPIEPERMTYFAKAVGTYQKVAKAYGITVNNSYVGKDEKVWYVYGADDFLIINARKEILVELMQAVGNPDGVNPLGVIPQVYVNKSKIDLCPVQDTDMLKLTKLVAVLLSDINFAVFFQAFSILYSIDVNVENLEASPSAFWNLKSDPTSGNRTPQIGALKPEVEIETVMNFIMSQISLWLQSQNIRPGAVGQAGPEDFTSGVSKIIDESDTSQDRANQVTYFIEAEKELWEKVMKYYHPYWVANRMIPVTNLFSPSATMSVTFPEQKPEVSRSIILDEQIKELNAGLTTKRRAIMKLNQDLNTSEIDELIEEIEDEQTITVEEKEDGSNAENGGGDQEDVDQEAKQEETAQKETQGEETDQG